MKTEMTGKFQSRYELEQFVIKSHLANGATAETARLAGVGEWIVRKIKRNYYESMVEPIVCPKCRVAPVMEPLKGGSLIFQCYECGECGKPAQNELGACRAWNEKARLWAAAMLPRRLGK